MINKLPRQFPSLADMMDDLSASPVQIAKVLDVNESTVYRWIKTGKAPRTVLMALYWITRWGLSELDAELFNAAATHRGYAESLKRQVGQLNNQLQLVARIADFGSANDPAPEIVSGNCFAVTVALTPDPGLRPTMPRPSCERHRLS